ncbi:MAG: sulfate adenylyltransferase subunit 2 [Deltaproteobacteria bacterium]|nr:MAG: sulfate adenylyltransferase subunit 2 [Deltaproteobacteria bacterium]
MSYALSSLDMLETEAMQIFWTVVGECDRPVMLFSGGKDSLCMLHIARKAFAPGRIPFPMLHVDTGHNFPELLAFRDHIAEAYELDLRVASVQAWIDDGRLTEPPDGSRNTLQIPVLLDALTTGGFDAAFGGARRDEERARAKERVFSHRDAFGQWDPKQQRPELWDVWNTRKRPGETLRVFPLSNWTELDVWCYIRREGIALPSLYLAHERELVEREGLLLAVDALNPLRDGEHSFRDTVRFRTLGDLPLTGGMRSAARDVTAVIAENLTASVSERGVGRGDDRASAAAMEDRKREGYF